MVSNSGPHLGTGAMSAYLAQNYVTACPPTTAVAVAGDGHCSVWVVETGPKLCVSEPVP
jgi:hypothetical protein